MQNLQAGLAIVRRMESEREKQTREEKAQSAAVLERLRTHVAQIEVRVFTCLQSRVVASYVRRSVSWNISHRTVCSRC